VAGSARLIGAAIGYLARVPQRLIAAVVAFGGGVLISALSFELMDEAYQRAGSAATGVGFLTGAAIYSAANLYLARRSAKHRKRSDGKQSSEAERGGSGLAIVIGVTMIGGGAVSAVAVAAIFISNVPEGLTSSAGMKRAHPPAYVFGVWGTIAVVSGPAAMLGFGVFSHFSAEVIAATTAVAAGRSWPSWPTP
jgi:zinc transporter, ZIP family